MTSIYVLQLEKGKYYVGKSEHPQVRFQEHKQGTGSAWTRTYKPVRILATIPNASHFEEDKVTKEYMAKHGIENVRGGSYVTTQLSDEDQRALQKEIWGAMDKCTRCGRTGHFVANCYASTNVSGRQLDDSDEEGWCCEHCDALFQSKIAVLTHEKYCQNKTKSYTTSKTACYRCGHTGHFANECYASSHAKGYSLDSESEYESEYELEYDSD